MSHSDLTIADFWGIDRLMPDFDDDKGVGLVLVNTAGGKRIFDELSMEKRLSSLVDVEPLNGGFKEYTRPHPKRLIFFQRFVAGEPVKNTVKSVLRVSLGWRMMKTMKRLCKIIIKAVIKQN